MALSGCFGFPNIGSSLDISHKIQGFLNNDVLQETLEISTKKIRQCKTSLPNSYSKARQNQKEKKTR